MINKFRGIAVTKKAVEDEITEEDVVNLTDEEKSSRSTLSQKKTVAVRGNGLVDVALISNGDIVSLETSDYNTNIVNNTASISYVVTATIVVEDSATATILDPQIESIKDIA